MARPAELAPTEHNGGMAKKSWSDLSPAQQAAIVVGGAAELALTTYAGRDLVHRPSSAVRGPKVLWLLAMVVQPLGPIAYLLVGRRGPRPSSPHAGDPPEL